MGADINVRKPRNLSDKEIFDMCSKIPIDVAINNGWLSFHYVYWGFGHVVKCENFVTRFIRKYKLIHGNWSY